MKMLTKKIYQILPYISVMMLPVVSCGDGVVTIGMISIVTVRVTGADSSRLLGSLEKAVMSKLNGKSNPEGAVRMSWLSPGLAVPVQVSVASL